jgi:hypothetical protein
MQLVYSPQCEVLYARPLILGVQGSSTHHRWVSLVQHEIKITTTGHKSIGIHPGVLPGFPSYHQQPLFSFSVTLGNWEIITKIFFFYRAAGEGEHAFLPLLVFKEANPFYSFVFFCNERNKREGPCSF